MSRSKKITELNSAPNISSEDLLLVVTNPTSNTAETKKISVANFLGNNSANVVISNKSTPANSTITIKQGTVLFDNDYLYIATANNVLKRVTLNSF